MSLTRRHFLGLSAVVVVGVLAPNLVEAAISPTPVEPIRDLFPGVGRLCTFDEAFAKIDQLVQRKECLDCLCLHSNDFRLTAEMMKVQPKLDAPIQYWLEALETQHKNRLIQQANRNSPVGIEHRDCQKIIEHLSGRFSGKRWDNPDNWDVDTGNMSAFNLTFSDKQTDIYYGVQADLWNNFSVAATIGPRCFYGNDHYSMETFCNHLSKWLDNAASLFGPNYRYISQRWGWDADGLIWYPLPTLKEALAEYRSVPLIYRQSDTTTT